MDESDCHPPPRPELTMATNPTPAKCSRTSPIQVSFTLPSTQQPDDSAAASDDLERQKLQLERERLQMEREKLQMQKEKHQMTAQDQTAETVGRDGAGQSYDGGDQDRDVQAADEKRRV